MTKDGLTDKYMTLIRWLRKRNFTFTGRELYLYREIDSAYYTGEPYGCSYGIKKFKYTILQLRYLESQGVIQAGESSDHTTIGLGYRSEEKIEELIRCGHIKE